MTYKFNPFTGKLDDAGPEVTALNTLGVKADLATIQAIVGPSVGDVWQADDTDIFYLWDGSAWVSLGTLGAAGPTGATGPAGADGADGADGVGVPVGGSTGQALVKVSATDYDTQWATVAISDGDKGDITVSGSGATWTIDAGVVDTSNLGGDITTAGKALLDDADAAAQRTTLGLGDAATKNTGTTAGTVAAGNDSRFTTDLTYTAGTRVLASSTGADATLPLFTSTDAGLTPLSGGGTTNFLRADGTWAAPAGGGGGGTPGGSSGQIQWNDAGAFAGVGGSTVGATGNITLSLNGAASTPPVSFTGTWFTGGTGTTTKPQLLIEPAGTTSTAWSTSGTGLGVNAASGFAGNLLDLQVNGTRRAAVFSNGTIGTQSTYGFGIEDVGAALYPGVRVAGAYQYEFGDIFTVGSGSGIGFGSTSSATGYANWADTVLRRDAADTLAQRRTTNAQTFRCYGTYTDASNYVRASLSSSSTAVTLAAETAGTGADDITLNLTAAGTGTVKSNSNVELADAKDIVLGSTTGTKIGTATTQKLGFYNKTPVVQPTAVADATDAASVITQLNALLSRMRDLGLIAT